jgi:hypothetical protein
VIGGVLGIEKCDIMLQIVFRSGDPINAIRKNPL